MTTIEEELSSALVPWSLVLEPRHAHVPCFAACDKLLNTLSVGVGTEEHLYGTEAGPDRLSEISSAYD